VARYDHKRTIAACAPGIDRPPPAAPPGHDRPGLSVPQLAALLGTRMEPGGRLRAVLFPRIDPAVRGIEIGPTPADAALLDLRQSLLEPSHPARYSEVFAPREAGRAIPPERHDEACRRLLECVPAYAARLGPDAFEHDLLGALSQAEVARPDRSGVR